MQKMNAVTPIKTDKIIPVNIIIRNETFIFFWKIVFKIPNILP